MNDIVAEVGITAAELARLSGAQASDIHYWGKKGCLVKKAKSSSPYPLSQLPKAKLMVLFASRLQIKAKRASEISDEFLCFYKDRSDAFSAMVAIVDVLNTRITKFVDLVIKLDLVSEIDKILSGEIEMPHR